MYSDIRIDKIIFQKLPPAWHPYIKLARFDRPIGIWLLLIPCWWGMVLAYGGIFNIPSQGWRDALLFAIGALLMRSAGCIVNDLWDQSLDASVERTKTRPLASGEITPVQAFVFMGVLLVLSLFVLLQFPRTVVILGMLALLPVAVYPLMKRLTWWPQLFLGFTFNWGILMGYASAAQTLGGAALVLYAGGVFWTLAYDTIYAHQDIEDDATAGIKSTARLFGDKSEWYVGGFFALSLLCSLTAKYMAAPSFLTALLLVPPIGHVVWQMRTWNREDPQSCLTVFKSNRTLGLLVLLMLAL